MPRQNSSNLSTLGHGTYIYKQRNDRYQAYVKYPEGYTKSGLFYDLEGAITFCRRMKDIPYSDIHWTEYLNLN
jgi:hypothetical protein